MTVEFNGVDIMDKAHWSDMLEVIDFYSGHRYRTDLGVETTEDMVQTMIEDDADVAADFVKLMSEHNSPWVRDMAGVEAFGLIKTHEDFAVNAIVRALSDPDPLARKEVTGYAYDVVTDDLGHSLRDVSLPNIAQFIRAFKLAMDKKVAESRRND